MFSKACEYGIRAIIYIAEQSPKGEKVNIKEIAKAIDSPEAFTAKILQQLARCRIVNSSKGPAGGFFIDKSQLEDTMLSDIVSAIDGDSILKGCALGLPECSNEKPCAIHHKFVEVRGDLKYMLENTSLFELAENMQNGKAFLKR